jgi:hypothetical protein
MLHAVDYFRSFHRLWFVLAHVGSLKRNFDRSTELSIHFLVRRKPNVIVPLHDIRIADLSCGRQGPRCLIT